MVKCLIPRAKSPYDEFTEINYIDFRNLSTCTGKSAKFCVLLLLRKK